MELERFEIATRIVDLVHEDDHGLGRRTEDRGDLLVARRHTCPGVDDEQDEVGLLDGSARLRRDVPPEGAGVRLVDAPRVDQAERDAVPVAQQLLAVARHARRLVHDGGPALGQSVDERRLADVREAHDRDGAGAADPLGL